MRSCPKQLAIRFLVSIIILIMMASVVGGASMKSYSAGTTEVVNAPLAGQTQTANVSGIWTSDEAADVFQITMDSSGQSIASTVLNDTRCHGQLHPMARTYFLKGTVQSDGSLKGTMERCVLNGTDSDFVKKCGYTDLWEPIFNATFTEDKITIQWRSEYIIINGPNDCHFDHYIWENMTLTRLDCRIHTFPELADKYLTDQPNRTQEIAIAQEMDQGSTKVYWTENQNKPGGFREKVDLLLVGLQQWGFLAKGKTVAQLEQDYVRSAYRPILYQGHFADLAVCAMKVRDTLKAMPWLAQNFKDLVNALNAEIDPKGPSNLDGHGIHVDESDITVIKGLTIKVPYVCYRPPLTDCEHTDEQAIDLDVHDTTGPGDFPTLGPTAAFYDFCRPRPVKDPIHFVYVGPDPWSVDKCHQSDLGPGGAVIRITGKSPVNLLASDPYGYRVGYDPVAGREVNDFNPEEAYYSGPGTHPQVIEFYPGTTTIGNYTVTGIGTGDGQYTITIEASSQEGYVLESKNVTGQALLNKPTMALNYAMKADYSAPSPWKEARFDTSDSTGSNYLVRTGISTSTTIHVNGDSSLRVIFSSEGHAIGLLNAGSSGKVTLRIPKTLLTGPFSTWADGEKLTTSVTETDTDTTLSFNVPSHAQKVLVQGSVNNPQAAGTSFLNSPLVLAAIIGGVAAGILALLAFLVLRRRRLESGPTSRNV